MPAGLENMATLVPGLVGVVSTAVTTVAVSVTSVVAVASSVRRPSSVTPAISVRLAIGYGSVGRVALAVVVLEERTQVN